MKIIQTILLCVVVFQQYASVEAVAATIYSGSTCGGSVLTSIENVPNSACYSFHGRGMTLTTPTSGRVVCSSEVAGSSWTAYIYGILSPANYDCSAASPFVVTWNGAGPNCVAILGTYSASVDCTVDPTALKLVSAGGVEAAIDRTEPFNIKIAPASGNITAGRYMKVSYSQLGEITSAGVVVDDETTTTPNVFHSIPLTDILIAANLDLYTEDTPYFSFVGYVGRVPQQYTTDVTAAGINLNFLSKVSAQISSYNVTLPGDTAITTMCLRGSVNGVCTPFQVNPGTLKNAIGLYNWTYSPSAADFRISYHYQLVGLTGAAVYFNGDTSAVPGTFTGQVTSITWKSNDAPFAFTFTQTVQQHFNKGDNTFGTASITSSGTAVDFLLNVDIPLAQLAVPSGSLGYWLYDPDFTVSTAESGSYSSSSALSIGVVSIVCLVLAVFYL